MGWGRKGLGGTPTVFSLLGLLSSALQLISEMLTKLVRFLSQPPTPSPPPPTYSHHFFFASEPLHCEDSGGTIFDTSMSK